MHDDTDTALGYIRENFPLRNSNVFARAILWNAIFEVRRQRIRQVARYPYNYRCIVPVTYTATYTPPRS